MSPASSPAPGDDNRTYLIDVLSQFNSRPGEGRDPPIRLLCRRKVGPDLRRNDILVYGSSRIGDDLPPLWRCSMLHPHFTPDINLGHLVQAGGLIASVAGGILGGYLGLRRGLRRPGFELPGALAGP